MGDFLTYTLPQLKMLILKDTIGKTWPVIDLDLCSAILDRVKFSEIYNQIKPPYSKQVLESLNEFLDRLPLSEFFIEYVINFKSTSPSMVTMDFMARSCLCDALRDLFIAPYKENTNNPTMYIADQDDSPGIDPLVLNLIYDQISLNPLYLNLAEHHQDRIMDKVVKALSGPTIVYDKSDPETLLIMELVSNVFKTLKNLFRD